MRPLAAITFPTAILVALATAPTAHAATIDRTLTQNAPGLCSANNPANQQYLRNLLTGLKNATTGPVSVVCANLGDDAGTSALKSAFVYFQNDKTTAGTVTCTVATKSPYWGETYYTKSMTLAGGANDALAWTTANYRTSVHNQWVNLQCSLPAGWIMQEVGSIRAEEVGA